MIDDHVLFQYAHDTRNKFCVVCRSLYIILGDAAMRELANLLCVKRGVSRGVVMGWLRCKLNFSLKTEIYGYVCSWCPVQLLRHLVRCQLLCRLLRLTISII